MARLIRAPSQHFFHDVLELGRRDPDGAAAVEGQHHVGPACDPAQLVYGDTATMLVHPKAKLVGPQRDRPTRDSTTGRRHDRRPKSIRPSANSGPPSASDPKVRQGVAAADRHDPGRHGAGSPREGADRHPQFPAA